MAAFTHIIRRKYENNIALSRRYIGNISRNKKNNIFPKGNM